MLSTLQDHVIIKVVGVGGAGCNALDEMISRKLSGVESIAVNTDERALARSTADKIIQIDGMRGRVGMGSKVPHELALQCRQQLEDALCGASMVFIAAGFGRDTGSGIAPLIAQIAKAQGALSIGVVYTPFSYEGKRPHHIAGEALQTMKQHTDSLFVIPHANLEEMDGNKSMTEILLWRDRMLYETVDIFAQMFAHTDNVAPSLFDLKLLMRKQGKAMFGVGTASGIDRTRIATERACAALSEKGIAISAARGLLFVITVSRNNRLVKLTQIMAIAGSLITSEASIVMSIVFDDAMRDDTRVSLIVTGITGI